MGLFGESQILRIYLLPFTLACSFTDEADQQRALIEMHGLYCLSRPSEFILQQTRIYSSSNPHSAYFTRHRQVQATYVGVAL